MSKRMSIITDVYLILVYVFIVLFVVSGDTSYYNVAYGLSSAIITALTLRGIEKAIRFFQKLESEDKAHE